MRKVVLLAALLVSALVQAETITPASGDEYAPYADRNLPTGGMTTALVKLASTLYVKAGTQ